MQHSQNIILKSVDDEIANKMEIIQNMSCLIVNQHYIFSKRSSEGAYLKRLERKMEKNDRESLVSRSEGPGEPVHLLLAHVIQECKG